MIVTSYLNTDWYATQLKDLTSPCPQGVDPSIDPSRIQCQRPYTAANTEAAYVSASSEAGDKFPLVINRSIQVPSKSVIPFTNEEIQEIALRYAPVDEDVRLPIGNVVATIAGGRFLSPWEQFALNLINESIDERPIYFASSGNAATSLGLQPYLYRQGLAFRLNNGPLEEIEDLGIVRMDPSAYSPVIGAWTDVPRTQQLLDEVFIHRTGIPDEWSHWPDIATIGIPSYYAWAYLALTQAAMQAEDEPALEQYQERAEAWSLLGV